MSSPFAMPFTSYDVQQQAADLLSHELHREYRPHPVVAIELPTGCGKTLTLLTSALRFQEEMKGLGPDAAEKVLLKQSPAAWAQSRRARRETVGKKKKQKGNDKKEEEGFEEVDEWTPPALFFQQFRPGATQKRLRSDELALIDGSNGKKLDGQGAPPASIFFVSRTHAQLAQAARELRKLPQGSKTVKMNIMSSRDRTCNNSRVRRDVANGTLPVEGNNLGEVCDKLVALGQCQMVQRFCELATRAISRPIGRNSTMVWEIEDLVAEGSAMEACPYYAARELVFHADITFATYNYLLDPVIRKETKFEAALKNHSIIIFDEAHNVPDVCRDSLSHEFTSAQLLMIIEEVRPLVADAGPGGVTTATRGEVASGEQQQEQKMAFAFLPTYPRSFCLTQWSLVELFNFFLDSVLLPVLRWVERESEFCPLPAATGPDAPKQQLQMMSGVEWISAVFGRNFAENVSQVWIAKFKQIYGILMSLGVTFNPFQFNIHTLAITKRLLVILRFLMLKPSGFAVWRNPTAEFPPPGGARSRTVPSAVTAETGDAAAVKSFTIRCCDSGLAFNHLASVCYAVVVASGTLAPFDQLAADLGVVGGAINLPTLEGDHVIDVSKQCRVSVVTHYYGNTANAAVPRPLRCLFGNLQSTDFVDGISRCILHLAGAVSHGGSLVFAPNYKMSALLADAFERDLEGSGEKKRFDVFREPARSELLPDVLNAYKRQTLSARKSAIMFAVYRGKLSEGIDFIDEMARLVMCVGLPFQPVTSPFVAAQKAFSGQAWYVADAVRAVNQALGRCIRHKNDFGAIVLLDDRYCNSIGDMLPRWCQRVVQTYASSSDCAADLKLFLDSCIANRGKHHQPLSALHTADEGKEKVPAPPAAECRAAVARAEPFARLCPPRPKDLCHRQLSDSAAVAPSPHEVKSVVEVSSGWFSVAQKLLCEEADDAALVRKDMIEQLALALQKRALLSQEEAMTCCT